MSLAGPLQQAAWVLSLYPDAGEAGGGFVPARRSPHVYVPPGYAADPVRARAEAGRRARAKVRRYCAANRLNRLGTLTFAGSGCHDPWALRSHMGLFFRNLRSELGGRPLPYVWVPEWHKTDHGLHAHFAVGRYINRSVISRAWGHGFVHIKSLTDVPTGTTTRGEARRAAGYLSKYVTKTFGHDLGGLHRYEVGQGFQPKRERFQGRTSDQVFDDACERMGGQPALRWSSAEAEEWHAPPAMWFAWD
jgi:hypothetical protein